MAYHAVQGLLIFLLACPTQRNQRFQHSHHHRIQHIRIVIVHAELASVAVPAVTHIPFLYFVLRHTQAELVGFFALLQQKGFGQTGKEQPVVVGTRTVAQGFERIQKTFLRHVIQRFPQSFRGTQKSMNHISRIYDGLRLFGEVQHVGRCRINSVLQPFQNLFAHLLAQFTFFRIVIRQGQPGSHASQRTAYSFQMGYFIIPGRIAAR